MMKKIKLLITAASLSLSAAILFIKGIVRLFKRKRFVKLFFFAGGVSLICGKVLYKKYAEYEKNEEIKLENDIRLSKLGKEGK